MFLRECIFGPFCYFFSFLIYTSLFFPFLSLCYFLSFYLDLCMLVQVKQVRWVLQFLLQNKGRGSLYNGRWG